MRTSTIQNVQISSEQALSGEGHVETRNDERVNAVGIFFVMSAPSTATSI